jgi:hypothetical protein
VIVTNFPKPHHSLPSTIALTRVNGLASVLSGFSCIVRPALAKGGVVLVFRALACASFALALAACGTPEAAPPPGQVVIAPQLKIALPRPGELGRTLEAAQLVTAHYGEQTIVFESHLSATPERFLLVGLDSLGRKALTITWTDAGIVTEAAPWLPDTLRADNILADIVLLYWPEAVVRRTLAAAGANLVSGPRQRRIIRAGEEVGRADYLPSRGGDPWNGRLRYRNLAWGYELEVQSTELTP